MWREPDSVVNDNDITCGMSGDQFRQVMRLARTMTLTTRQTEIVSHIQAGRTTKEIARRLTLSPATIKAHLAIIYVKAGVPNRVALAGLGLVPQWRDHRRQSDRSGSYLATGK
jgi:DNA-binding CsgD family transcriptional regulator